MTYNKTTHHLNQIVSKERMNVEKLSNTKHEYAITQPQKIPNPVNTEHMEFK
jgi:hypothetical protein